MSLECSWEEFKRMARDFHESAPTLNSNELHNAWKCLGLGYLNMSEKMWTHSAVALLNMESKMYFDCEFNLSSREK